MRTSRVLDRLRAGEVANIFKLNLESVRAAEIAALAGYDSVWADMEHVPNDISVVEQQIYAAKSLNCDVMVRVARGGYSDYIRPLEMDAAGIMVPHIMSLEDARNVVRMTRFHPLGRRPVDGGNADGEYCGYDFQEYLRFTNRNRFLAIQIEDPEPLDDLEEIARLEGIDIIFFGPADFSQGIGAPGDFRHPKLIETRERVAEVCLRHGKFAGTTSTPENAQEYVDMGYRFLAMGADVLALRPYCDTLVKVLNGLKL